MAIFKTNGRGMNSGFTMATTTIFNSNLLVFLLSKLPLSSLFHYYNQILCRLV